MGLIDQNIIDITPWCIRLDPAASVSEELRQFQDKKGRIDFGDKEALNAYNKAAFKVMADLDITIPDGNLIPTACLRQAYLTVLAEELLPRGSTIIEIGTGATAVISMLAAKNHDLKVIATEIDPVSYQYAKDNISANKLEDRIELVLSKNGIIKDELDHIFTTGKEVDAILCYPPTYPEEDSKAYETPQEGSGFMGTVSEMIGGGEAGYDFIRQYLEEAVKYHIKWITVLLIFESHAKVALDQLKQHKLNVTQVKLKAGTRTRYLIIAKNFEN